MSKPIYILNGPNLNLLGTREPDIYGAETLADIEAKLIAMAADQAIVFRQSNHEGELVDWIQEASKNAGALILNGGAYTHTSVALHDALRSCGVPIIEVHLSNPAAREEFRQRNFISPLAKGTIAGLGGHGYELAFQAALQLVK